MSAGPQPRFPFHSGQGSFLPGSSGSGVSVFSCQKVGAPTKTSKTMNRTKDQPRKKVTPTSHQQATSLHFLSHSDKYKLTASS